MRFIFHYPESGGPDGDVQDAGPLGEVAQLAERSGFHGFSLSEHPIPGSRWLANGGHKTLDSLTALAYVAGRTERLRLLTYLAVAPYRNPFILAKAAATIDTLSGGRFILGLGAGYQKSEFFALGVDFDERNALFDEALEVLPLHWKGEPFSYEGRHFNAREVLARPRPVQDPIPIWIGGNSAASRRRAATAGQGWMPMTGGAQLSTTARTPALGGLEELAGHIETVRTKAEEAGRDRDLDILYSYQDQTLTDPAQADRHRETFAELERIGVTWVVVSSRSTDPAATTDFVEAVGANYLK